MKAEYPNRHSNHTLESASERYVKYHMPKEWTFSKPSNDYGIDLICEVILDDEIKGYEYGIQLKSKKIEKNPDYVLVKGLKRTSINYWLNSIKPIMLIVYIEQEKQAYWHWIDNSSFDLTKPTAKFQLKITKKNNISQANINLISSYIKNYYIEILRLKNLPDFEKDYGWQLYIERKYEEALPYLKKMPKSTETLNAIAICYYRSFQYENALISINESLEEDINNSVLLSNKSSILIELGDRKKDDDLIRKGLEIIDSIIDNNNFTNDTYYNYGNGFMNLGLYEQAEYVFKKVLEKNPNKAEAWKNLGSVYHNLGFFEKEISCYDKSLLINPSLIEAISSKGVTLFKVYRKYKEALVLFKKVIKIDKEERYKFEYPYVDFYIAECYSILGNHQKAKYWNTIGLKNNPTDEYFINQRERLS
jgi:tetratricopeptide (TPR) repeat protein